MSVETPTCRLISRGLSHPGYVRRANEDAFLDMPQAGLWAVADGMGGHADGAFASRRIVAALQRLGVAHSGLPLVARLDTVLQGVNAELLRRAAELGAAQVVGSTLVVLVLEDEHFHCFWAGDSRLYLWRDGRLQQLTRDHSVTAAPARAGVPAPAAGLTRAVGADVRLELEYLRGYLYEDDLFLLCSDGLTKVVDDAALAAVLAGQRPEQACQALLDTALGGGAPDNVSCVTVYLGV